jgi:hypothetical protein
MVKLSKLQRAALEWAVELGGESAARAGTAQSLVKRGFAEQGRGGTQVVITQAGRDALAAQED